MQTSLRPFWCYYGGKWRAAPRYPEPKHDTIIEPFAGAAGYALRYPEKNVVLVDKYHVVAEMWRYLIGASVAEIMSIPLVDNIDDLPSGLPEGARWLVGFNLNDANTRPCRTLSAGLKRLRESGRTLAGWGEARRVQTARQVSSIRHWKVIEGDYTEAPDIEATWFIDPPYDNRAGSYYAKQVNDYASLAVWCQGRKGQVLVCENEGADWLPFSPFATLKAGINGSGSKEMFWCSP